MDRLSSKRPSHRGQDEKSFVEECCVMLDAIEHELVDPYVKKFIYAGGDDFLLRPVRLRKWCVWPSEIKTQEDLDAISCNMTIICRELQKLRPQQDAAADGIDDCISEWQAMMGASSVRQWGESFGMASVHLQTALWALQHP